MRMNNFIRAVVAIIFGALAYFALTANSPTEAADQLVHKVEVRKATIVHKVPKAVKTTAQETGEWFVENTPAPAPRGTPQPVKEAVDVAAERTRRLEEQAKKDAQVKRVVLEKAKKEKEKRAKEAAAERAKKVKAEERFKENEKEKKRREKAAAEHKRRKSMRGVPVPGAVIGATFGARGPWARYHTGLDFRAGFGTPVKAVAPGRIIYAGNSGNWAGNHVVIKHSDGKKTLYAHMSSISRHGGRVRAGDRIGLVGRTGRAFGAHLHLELYPVGAHPGDVYSAIDPRSWLRSRGVRFG